MDLDEMRWKVDKAFDWTERLFTEHDVVAISIIPGCAADVQIKNEAFAKQWPDEKWKLQKTGNEHAAVWLDGVRFCSCRVPEPTEKPW